MQINFVKWDGSQETAEKHMKLGQEYHLMDAAGRVHTMRLVYTFGPKPFCFIGVSDYYMQDGLTELTHYPLIEDLWG